MSTEQKPPPAPTPAPAKDATQPKAEPNALAAWLSNAWTRFKQGKLIGYPMMALVLVLVAAIGVGWWILRERGKAEAGRWIERDGIVSVADLDKFAEKHPNSIHAKLAKLEIARIHIGPEGMDQLFVTGDPFNPEVARRAREMRTTAVANVEKAREEFAKLADEFKNDPVIRVECMLACAKAEAILVGIPKEGKAPNPLDPKPLTPGDSRGDPLKAVEWLDKVAKEAPDTDWGKDAQKLADTLRNQNTQQQVATLQASLFELAPRFDTSKMPKDAAHGFPGP
jgi:hypothetical protein